MYHNPNHNSISQLNQIESTVQQLIQQTQQATTQYQQLLKQEQENAALLQQIAQREHQAAHIIQTALQGHHTAIQQLNNITNLCHQVSQWTTTQNTAYLQNSNQNFANQSGYYRQ